MVKIESLYSVAKPTKYSRDIGLTKQRIIRLRGRSTRQKSMWHPAWCYAVCTAARGFEDFKNWRCDVHLCSSWRYCAWHSWPRLAECERVGPAPQDGYRCDVANLSTGRLRS